MRVRLDRFEAANSSVQWRTLVAFLAGGVGLVFFGFLTFLGFLMIIWPDGEGGGIWPRRTGIFLGFFLGVVPVVLSGAAIGWGVRRRGRMRRLGELAAIARQTSWLTSQQVANGLAIPLIDAERLIVEASGLGLIEEGAPPALAPPSPRSNEPAAHAATVEGPPVALGPGATLGAYRIEEPLGQGGMGAVFAARHLRTGRRYALKTILAGPSASEATLRRFEREATAASALGHPGLVQVHDFDRAPGGVFFLVMDLLEGETLEARLARTGPLPWRDVQRIALELCDALAAAHDQGLVHRDIKPSNVFLARDGRAGKERTVLVDFGLMKQIEASGVTSTGVVIGTPMYMSPEQARGEALDVRSDLYSLAAVIFEMTTGAPPFKDRTLASVYARLLQEPAPLASQASGRRSPPALDPVLGRALAKNREGRFPDARALSTALAGVDMDAPPATVRLA